MSGPATKYPDRAVVERIVREEAIAGRAKVADVLNASNRVAAKRARTRAIVRIMTETGCSHRGLEKVWGASLKRVARRSVHRDTELEITTARLVWAYGDARANQILAGKDPNTNRDIAAWKRLCALGGGQ